MKREAKYLVLSYVYFPGTTPYRNYWLSDDIGIIQELSRKLAREMISHCTMVFLKSTFGVLPDQHNRVYKLIY